MLTYAKKYLSLGMNVIPTQGKNPLIKWKKFQNVRVTEQLVEQWWTAYPEANIAVVLGEVSGNLAVVDLDSDDAIREFKALGAPTNTLISRTARGYHIFYRVPKCFPSTKVGNIEIKCTGSIVVIPPSKHPSGVQYRWTHSLDNYQIAEVDLKNYIKTLPEVSTTNTDNHHTSFKSLYRGVPQGMRNQTLTRLVGHWFKMGFSVEEVIEIARVWNQTCKPPLDDREVLTTVRSIWNREQSLRQQVSDTVREILKPEKTIREILETVKDPTVLGRITLLELYNHMEGNND